MKKILLFIACNCIIIILSQAQELKPPVNIQSPNAAGLGKYGDVPVSYFTGTPSISVPLHTLSYRGIDLNISLNYDASGVRIDQHPGIVGQNWSLAAGGVITRTVVGNSDELDFTNTNIDIWSGALKKVGYFYNYSDLNDVNTSSANNLKTLAENVTSKGADYQPDIFTFNFMGITGKFFLDNDGKWKVNSDNNIMVVFENNNFVPPLFIHNPYDSPNDHHYPKVFGGFKLIDGDGTTYVFGYDSTAIEYSIDFFHQYFPVDLQSIMWRANAWFLTKVIDKYQNEIYQFEYERGSFIADFYRTDTDKKWKLQGQSKIWKPVPGCSFYNSMRSEAYNIEGNLISPVYLKRISMPSVNDANQVILLSYSNTTETKFDPLVLKAKYDELQMQYYQVSGYPYPLYFLQISNPYIDATKGDNYLENLHWRKLDNIALYGNLNRNIKFLYNNSTTERLNLLGIDIISGDWRIIQVIRSFLIHSVIINLILCQDIFQR